MKAGRLGHIDEAAVAEIRKLQPFYLYEFAGHVDNAGQRSLAETATLNRLSVLSNTDKHRRILLAAGHVEVHWLALAPQQLVTELRPIEPPPWSDGSLICEWTVDDSGATASVEQNPPQVGSQLIVSFLSDIQSRSEQSVLSSLEAMYYAVNHVVWKLTPFLPD